MVNIETSLGYVFNDKKVLDGAICHSSVKRNAVNFERLEFLGDSVLGVVVAEYIFRSFSGSEGAMSRMHSAFVCADSCYRIAIDIGLDKVIKVVGSHLRTNKTVLADATEAVLGAVFLDGGYDSVKRVILDLWGHMFDSYNEKDQEPKTQLQELCQVGGGSPPVYTLISVKGPEHKPEFLVSVYAFGETFQASGGSKKTAETEVARIALEKLSSRIK